uniref:Cell division protein n=1 Tax=Nitella hyalina TaxID=181804 RepID=A0A2H4G3C7_NITHY|nr:cell division protein [Nitella hyalina]
MFVTSLRNEIVQKLWIYWITVFFRKYKKSFFYSLSIFLLWNFIKLLFATVIKFTYFCLSYQYIHIIVSSFGLTLLSLYIFYVLSNILGLILFFVFLFICGLYFSLSKFIYFLILVKNLVLCTINIFFYFSESLCLLPLFIEKYFFKNLFLFYCRISSFIFTIFINLLKPLGLLPLLPLILDISNEYQKFIRILYYTIIDKIIRFVLFLKLELDGLRLKNIIKKKIKRLVMILVKNSFYLRIILSKRKSFQPSYWPIPLVSFILNNKNWYKCFFVISKEKKEHKLVLFDWFLTNDLNKDNFINSEKEKKLTTINTYFFKNKQLQKKEFQCTNFSTRSIKNYNNTLQYASYNAKNSFHHNYLINNITWQYFVYKNNINYISKENQKNKLFHWLFQGPYRFIFENNNSFMLIGSPEITGYPFLSSIVEAINIPLIYLSCKDLLYISSNKERNLLYSSNYAFQFKVALSLDMAKELSPSILFLDDIDSFYEESSFLFKNNNLREETLDNFEFETNNKNSLSKSQEKKEFFLDCQVTNSNVYNNKNFSFQDNNKVQDLRFRINEFKSHSLTRLSGSTYSYRFLFNWLRELNYQEINKNIFLLIYSKLPKKLDPTFFFYVKQVFYIKSLDLSIYDDSFKIFNYKKKDIFNYSFVNLSIKNNLLKKIINFINDSKFENFWWIKNNLLLNSILNFHNLFIFYNKFYILNDSVLDLQLIPKNSKNCYANLDLSFFIRWEEIYYILGRITLENNLLIYSPTFLLFLYNNEYELKNYYLSSLYIESSSSEPLVLQFNVMVQIIKSLSGLVSRDLFLLRLQKNNPWTFNYGTSRASEDLCLIYHLFQAIMFQCYNIRTFSDNNTKIKNSISSSIETRNLLYMFEKNNQIEIRDWLFRYPLKTKSNYMRRTAPFSLTYTSTIWTIIRRNMNGIQKRISYFHPYSNYRHKYYSLLPISSFTSLEAPKESEARKCIPERFYLANNSTDFFRIPSLKEKRISSSTSKRKYRYSKYEFETLVFRKGDNNKKSTQFIFNENSLSLNKIWNKYEDGIRWLLNPQKTILPNFSQVALWRDLDYMLKLYLIYMIKRMEKIDFFLPVHLSMMGPLRFYAGYTYMDPKKILQFRDNEDVSKIIEKSDPITPFCSEKPSEELWFGLNEKIIRVLSLTLHPYFQRPLLYLSMMRIWGHLISPPSSFSKAISSHSILYSIPSYARDEQFDLYGLTKIDSVIYSLIFDSYNYLFYHFLNHMKIFDIIINKLVKSNCISKEEIENILQKIVFFS